MRARGQRGSATLLVLSMAGVLLLVGAALGVVAALVRTHRLAQSAADLAALAGAQALELGGDGCGRAAEIAAANHARLSDCSLQATVVTLRVTVAGPHWLGQTADLTAEARAGPAAAGTVLSRAGWAARRPATSAPPRWPAADADAVLLAGAAALSSGRAE